VLTAAITAAIASILSLFGIKPGPYLVVVAAVVKGIIILVGLLLGAKVVRKRAKAKAAEQPAPLPPTERPPEQHQP
jgi:hypothetical protein